MGGGYLRAPFGFLKFPETGSFGSARVSDPKNGRFSFGFPFQPQIRGIPSPASMLSLALRGVFRRKVSSGEIRGKASGGFGRPVRGFGGTTRRCIAEKVVTSPAMKVPVLKSRFFLGSTLLLWCMLPRDARRLDNFCQLMGFLN